jgi:hypothetical protein
MKMNNMYDILKTMNLLESKGSKPDFLDLDKDGNRKEPMKSAATDSNKPKKTFSKMGEADMGEGNRFTGNLMKARAAGKKQADLDGDGDMETVREYDFDDRDDFDNRAKPGDTLKTTKGTLKKTSRGIQHTRRADDEDTGSDDDYDEHGNLKSGAKKSSDGPKKKGRPAGTKRAIGAKGPSGKSKLLQKGSIKENDIALVDKGEYDREGDMAREQLHTIESAAQELHDLLSDDQNLPEWVQSKITKAMDYIDTARDYMMSQEHDQEQIMPERKLSSSEKEEREDIVKGMKKSKGEFKKRYGKRGEEVMYATATKMAKERGPGNPDRKKKEESVKETTVAGSVATAPAGGKASKGMQFGKGVYEGQIAESFEKKLGQLLNEGMSINMSMGEDGTKSLTVSATDEDAMQLAQLLKMAGIGSGSGYQETCSACGSSNCGCEQMDEAQNDLANAPDEETETTEYMTKTIAGGLNKPKRDVAGNGQTTVPVSAVRVQEEADIESHLTNLYKQFKA